MARSELREAWHNVASHQDYDFMVDVAREAAQAALSIPTGDHWA